MVSRLPYFKFFPSDWIASEHVSLMDLAAQGAFVRLLAHQWMNGTVPSDPRALAGLCGVSTETFTHEIWPQLADRFPQVADGRLANDTLDAQLSDALATSQRHARAGRKGGLAKAAQTQGRKGLASPAKARPEPGSSNALAYTDTEAETDTQKRTSSSARAREPAGLSELHALLRHAAPAVNGAAGAVTGSRTWPTAIVGMYGPHGTKRAVIADLDEDVISEVLAESVVALAGEGSGRWSQPFFDSIVRRVAKARREGETWEGLSNADRRVLESRQRMESWDLEATP